MFLNGLSAKRLKSAAKVLIFYKGAMMQVYKNHSVKHFLG